MQERKERKKKKKNREGKKRVGGQKSPNENGPLRQKLMTGDQKSKISIQHFELFRVAGHLFAMQMPMLSIPPQLSLSLYSFFFLSVSRAGEWPCLRVRRQTRSQLSRERKLRPCKARDYLPFSTRPGFNSHRGTETNKTKVRKHVL